jgi:hypothetical protein
VGAIVLGLLLEEEGEPIWDLWAPLCRATIGRLWGRPVCGSGVAFLSPAVEGLREN